MTDPFDPIVPFSGDPQDPDSPELPGAPLSPAVPSPDGIDPQDPCAPPGDPKTPQTPQPPHDPENPQTPQPPQDPESPQPPQTPPDPFALAGALRARRLTALADALLSRAEQAASELDVYLLKRVTKTKLVEYANEQRPDKPTRETVTEEEALTPYRGPVDRAALKQLTGALQEIRELHLLRPALDVREQQARIAKLEQQLSFTDDGRIEIVLGDAEELAG